MTIGIIAAMDIEFNNIYSNLKNVEAKKFGTLEVFKGLVDNNEVVITKCGVGKVNAGIAAAVLATHYNPAVIINSGIAGGIKPLHPADVVVAESLAYSDVDVEAFGYAFGMIPGMPLYYETDKAIREKLCSILSANKIEYKLGTCYTADTFRSSAKEIKNDIREICCCEMEGAAIAQACYRLGVAFASIRFISDILDSDEHIEEYSKFEKEAANMSANITLELIRQL